MNNFGKTCFILVTLLIAGNLISSAEIVDKILVVVNEEVITQREVNRKLAPLYAQHNTMYDDAAFFEKIKQARRQVLAQLINDKLVISEARRKGIEVTDKEIVAEIASIKKRFKTDEEFYLALEEQGISLAELKDNYTSSLMAKKLVETEIGSRTVVTPIEIIEYYKGHTDKFIIPRKAKVRSILVRITAERDSEKALNLAKEILEKLANGEEFSALAMRYSDDQYASRGGDMGYIKKGEMIKRIDDAIFKLGKTETSEIIRTDLGFHIFKVDDISKAESTPFEAVSDKIENALFSKKVNEKLKGFIKQLKEKAYIEFK